MDGWNCRDVEWLKRCRIRMRMENVFRKEGKCRFRVCRVLE